MSQEFSKWLVNGIFHPLINGIYWGYNPLIRSPLLKLVGVVTSKLMAADPTTRKESNKNEGLDGHSR